MKKMLAIALVALSAAAAQAVVMTDVTDSGWTTFTSGERFDSTTYNIDTAQAYAVAIVFNSSSLTSGSTSTLFQLANAASGNTNRYRLIISEDGTLTAATFGSSSYVTITGSTSLSFKDGTNSLVAYVAASTTQTPTVTIYLNGEQVATVSATTVSDARPTRLDYATTDVAEAYVVNLNTADDATISEALAAMAAHAEEIDTIPEPTCLALLALGVAGLALKRKVA